MDSDEGFEPVRCRLCKHHKDDQTCSVATTEGLVEVIPCGIQTCLDFEVRPGAEFLLETLRACDHAKVR